MDIGEIFTYIGTALGGGGVVQLFNWRINKRKDLASVKADEIDNIRKTMDEVYRPIIEDLKTQIGELRKEVNEVREENERLKAENAELRNAVREIRPDIVPSIKSVQATNQPRKGNGQFTKKEDKV